MSVLDLPILSTAVAIVISWALYALFCSYVLEAWAQIAANRGRFMKDYLFMQLKDNPNGINWADKIYNHGTIDLLSRDPKKPTNDISPKIFAETLIEVVGSAQLVQAQINNLPTGVPVPPFQSKVLRDFKLATQLLNSSDLVTLFRQAMSSAELKSAAGASEDELYRHLTEYFEKWFGELTNRLTLWYKKISRQRLFFVGVILGVVINVDSIQLFSFYEQDPIARAAVIQYYKDHPELLKSEINQVSGIPIKETPKEEGEQTESDTTPAAAAAAVLPDTTKPVAAQAASPVQIDTTKLRQFKNSMDSLILAAKLPVGIKYNLFNQQPTPKFEYYLWKILGILISGFAASFGAPFWFDLLKKATTKI